MKWAAAAAAATASAAATAVASAATAAGSERRVTPCSNPTGSPASRGNGRRSAAEDRFAPRFDGLRFIETLVTAHR